MVPNHLSHKKNPVVQVHQINSDSNLQRLNLMEVFLDYLLLDG